MDTNHRGGPPGFVRVRYDPTTSSHELLYPEYSGNRLYQTLGNLQTTPYAGIVIPNFITGDVLYITGTASIHIGKDASALLPRSNVVVKVRLTDHKFVKHGLPFKASNTTSTDEGRSPYNPRLRLLSEEQPRKDSPDGFETRQTATLLSQTPLTPTISRFSFSLSNPSSTSSTTWKPGQYIMLDFSSELNEGYSHMRDDDPRSINDDFIRSFTISSPPPSSPPLTTSNPNQPATASRAAESRGSTFELTLRKIANGPVTTHLFRHGTSTRAATTSPLEIPILGFSGSFGFDVAKARATAEATQSSDEADAEADAEAKLVYICSGVGITPLLAQIPELDSSANMSLSRLLIFWTVHADDVPFVIDTLTRTPMLTHPTPTRNATPQLKIFITGTPSTANTPLQKLADQGAQILPRRFTEADFAMLRHQQQSKDDGKHQVCVCANPKLTAVLREWLQKLDVEIESEDFAY